MAMTAAASFNPRTRIRKTFGRLREATPMPNLIEVQKSSYDQFLQMDVGPDRRADDVGLQEVFRSVFPITDFSGSSELQFVRYELQEAQYDVEECQRRGITYAAPLRVTLRLVLYDLDEDTGTRQLRETKEQSVYMGDIPLMTRNGTFVINGTERVIVSQMHRSPGVFFDHDKGKTHSSGKFLFAARVIPYRGSWLDFEFDAKDIVYVRIDRRRKLPATTLLLGLLNERSEAYLRDCERSGEEPSRLRISGLSEEEILRTFYRTVDYRRSGATDGAPTGTDRWRRPFDLAVARRQQKQTLRHDLVDTSTGEVMVEAGSIITRRQVNRLTSEHDLEVHEGAEDMIGQYVAGDIVDEETGIVIADAGAEVTQKLLDDLAENGVNDLELLDIDHINVGAYIRNTLAVDQNRTREQALADIYRVMRPGEPPTLESAEALFKGLFFDSDRYDLSAVGRVKMNARLGRETPDTMRTLEKDDIIGILKVLMDLKDGRGEIDDIDHLGNRRVRSVGELMENQYRIGLLRMERAIRERMSSVEVATVMPQDLINAKPAAAAVREFFGSSQLSQFMDQTNPLSEITHKRRLSALGPGGLTRERAGFEVRDVHPTHYGRICPVETPEGPNIGLINSLATYARINKYGFIETPYRSVSNGVVTDEVQYLSATDEVRYTIAEANAELDEDGRFVEDLVPARRRGDIGLVRREDIDLIDVSPKQLVSVAAALIPFLENDDANRALMGSNMQRQAVPLVRAEAPYVGTGMEGTVARDSGVAIVARRSGTVVQIDAQRIVVQATDDRDTAHSNVDIYRMLKFQRSNQNTCVNQRPLVSVGEQVVAGDIIADGPSTDHGELALGRNVLVAFMPWQGYNFEDSILISERIVRDDVFTSIHIEEFEVVARDTKLGQEEITHDIPNVSQEQLKDLEGSGIIAVGVEVNPGDILVGKVTPKGESPMTPEEKLLRAIFGEKASDIRDTSLRVPPGVSGTVVEVRVFSRRGIDLDDRANLLVEAEIQQLSKDYQDERMILQQGYRARVRGILLGCEAVSGPEGFEGPGPVTDPMLQACAPGHWDRIVVADEQVMTYLEAVKDQHAALLEQLEARYENKKEKATRGDDLAPGVMKMVKVFVAVKRKLQPGDKMAGRHGNKGVISKIAPIEDMPYLEDGTPVDVVLNPLGVPSRMNVGQILETHLGWASHGLGRQISRMLESVGTDATPLRDTLRSIYGEEQYDSRIAPLDDEQVKAVSHSLADGVPMDTPVFDGARQQDVEEMLDRAGLDTSGQVTLIDGRTGEPFERKVTVGYIYMLKLHHLVDDKIHARSIGPYSLVTQQPLGGKAQFGGQRFGEMEVWALEAYGAAYTLQEMLTVKSDDVSGRTKVYEAIVRGDDNFDAGIPESFNVLVKELKSLGLNVDLDQQQY
ncbi:MAG: DNA-directed RNA polymerase subunit beta [Alphaproteobacteria bacterium]|nr:DNA-directed RNA polymerase subunit beta [Alphaproteobacteria bacterium]